MSAFTDAEIEYLNEQKLGRLATVDSKGEPYVVPVGFLYNPELGTIDIAGRNLGESLKFRHVAQSGRAAFVVDDVLPPWQPRGVRIRGNAEALSDESRPFVAPWGARVPDLIRITPTHITSWGLESQNAYESNTRKVPEAEVAAESVSIGG
jgi:pyridoxamine 5'-phosphate oxidase family protein